MSAAMLTTWRTSAEVAADVRLMDDVTQGLASRLAAIGRTSLDERDAHVAAGALLWRAQHLTPRGKLAIPAQLRTLTALAAPAVVVLSAQLEASGPVTVAEVFARFALAPRHVGEVEEASVIDASLVELVRRRLVVRSGETVKASDAMRRRCS